MKDARKTNAQLIDELEVLRRQVSALQDKEGQWKATENRLRKITKEHSERIKELNCLYSISRLLESPGISLDDAFHGIVDLIPAAWQYDCSDLRS